MSSCGRFGMNCDCETLLGKTAMLVKPVPFPRRAHSTSAMMQGLASKNGAANAKMHGLCFCEFSRGRGRRSRGSPEGPDDRENPSGTCGSLWAAVFGGGGKALQTAVPRSWYCTRTGALDRPCSQLSSSSVSPATCSAAHCTEDQALDLNPVRILAADMPIHPRQTSRVRNVRSMLSYVSCPMWQEPHTNEI